MGVWSLYLDSSFMHYSPFTMRLDLAGPAGREALLRLQRADMRAEMSAYRPPAGGLRLPSGKHGGILTHFQTKVKKKI